MKSQNEKGRKDDAGKRPRSLLPWRAAGIVVDVLAFGAKKYGAEDWRLVHGADVRYFDAAIRHLDKYRRGEWLDDESGLPHLAHAACCALFILELAVAEVDGRRG